MVLSSRYLHALIYFNTKVPDMCKIVLRMLRYIVCHNTERDLDFGALDSAIVPTPGVVIDDVLHALQLLLGSSHSLSADYTFFNAMVTLLLAHVPQEEHSRIYREVMSMDSRNHMLRWWYVGQGVCCLP